MATLPKRQYIRDDGSPVFLTPADITQAFTAPNSPLPVSAGGTGQSTGNFTSGTWTPVDASGAGLVFSAVHVGFSCAGKLVFIYGQLTYPGNASISPAKIGGLPFPVPNNFYVEGSFAAATTNSSLFIVPVINSSNFVLLSNLGTAVQNQGVSAQAIAFNFWYPLT